MTRLPRHRGIFITNPKCTPTLHIQAPVCIVPYPHNLFIHAVYIKDGVTTILYLIFISHTQAQTNLSGRRYKTTVLLVQHLSLVMQDVGLNGIS